VRSEAMHFFFTGLFLKFEALVVLLY
jgi:hypothetical protein